MTRRRRKQLKQRWVARKRLRKKLRRKAGATGAAAKSRRRSVFRDPTVNICREKLEGKDISRRAVLFPGLGAEPRATIIAIPPEFSFIDAPDAVLNVLHTVTKAATSKKRCSLFFDHSKCERMDLGASIALDALVMSVAQEFQRNRRGAIAGQLPTNEKVLDLLRGTGMLKHLGIKGQALAADAKRKYIYFPLRRGRVAKKVTANESTEAEKAAQDVGTHFNRCLETQGFELTPLGIRTITKLIGEVIDNAEEHAGESDWFVIGYLDQSQTVGECQLAVLNFGTTISESLQSDGTPEATRNRVATLVAKHEKKRFFNLFDWHEESLWTLFALQDGVSRFSKTPEGQDRGGGTIKMIQFFQMLGDSSDRSKAPKMVVISGQTRILFDPKYTLKKRRIGRERRLVIAFNATNSLERKPDAEYVSRLHGFFPGTAICLRFYLDRKHLKNV